MHVQSQAISPPTFGFGSAIGTHRFTVTNTGSQPVGPMTSLVTGADASEFEIVAPEDQCSNRINAPGAS